MKKNLLVFVFAMFTGMAAFAQTAPDFTANDCNGNLHNLYTELNSGKVIVLCWVMPCGACVGPSLTAYNIVQSYASSNVVFYLIDDDGGTSCTSLSSWATSSGIGANRLTFSTSAIVENNYGGIGMPHVVVVGTSNHTIYFNGLNANAGDVTGIQNGINTALTASGIATVTSHPFQLSIAYSSTSPNIKVNYSINESANVALQIFNEIGQSVIKKDIGKQVTGDYSSDIDLNKAAAGIYYLRLSAGSNSETAKFTISK